MYRITISNQRQQEQRILPAGAAVPIVCRPRDVEQLLQGHDVLVVDDDTFAPYRILLSVEPDQVELVNCGQVLTLDSGDKIESGAAWNSARGLTFRAGQTTIQIENIVADQRVLDSLSELAADRALDGLVVPNDGRHSAGWGEVPSAGTVSRWLNHIGALLTSETNLAEFLQLATETIAEAVGFDRVLILDPLSERNRWNVICSFASDGFGDLEFDARVVQMVSRRNRTLFHNSADSQVSQLPMFLVVSPLRNEQGEVTKIIYAARHRGQTSRRMGIRPLEAQCVQLLAETISGVLVRIRREHDNAVRSTVLNQVFCPRVTQAMLADPGILEGRTREITVMFCDLRRFSSLACDLGPEATYDLLSDLMNLITDEIFRFEGVVIDYYGDGVAAMWNAPLDQPRHADLACQAGFQIQRRLESLNTAWAGQVAPLELGIGIHTGHAMVGNAGSKKRIKYGPRGATVNVASRIEQATKKLGVPMLISGTTVNKCSADLQFQKLCTAEFDGSDSPLEVFEVLGIEGKSPSLDRVRELSEFQRALDSFESGQFNDARHTLRRLRDSAFADVRSRGEFLNNLVEMYQNQHHARRITDIKFSPIQPVIDLKKP